MPKNSAAAQLFHSVFCRPESLTRQSIAMVLIWAMVMTCVPVYAADHRSAQWVTGTGPFGSLRPAEQNSVRPELQPGTEQRRQSLRAAPRPSLLAHLASAGVPSLFGPPAPAAVAPAPSMQAGSPALQVSVGFADSSSPSAAFPEPWNESNPLLRFAGAGTAYRAGAIRLDNPTGADVTVDSVTVDLGRPGPLFQLWNSVTVPAFGSTVLTQTQNGNFNTSGSPIAGCGVALAANETRIPKVTVTVAGTSTDYLDTAHVLDTGGFDSSCRGNQSLGWRPIGTAGMEAPSAVVQLITDQAPHAVGTQDVVNVQVNDASGQGLANVPVSLQVVNGPNAGKNFAGVTDASGNATVQYSSTAQGTDLLQAVVSNLSGSSLQSQQVSTVWTSADACSAPATPNAAATRMIYVGQTSATFGNPLRLAALLTDGTGTPLAGRNLSFTYGGQTVSATTDNNGVATTQASLGVGQTAVTISFAGEPQFQPVQLSASASVTRAATLLRYTGTNLVASVGTQMVSAVLTDAQGRIAVVGRTVSFTLNGITVTGVTDINGVATAALNFTAEQVSGPAQLQISFAGDTNYQPGTRTVPVQVYAVMPFVIWGGNSNGLRIGNRVNFWGAQWEQQVINGQYFAANPSFKGWAGSVPALQQCQVNATPVTLTTACWQVKPGQSFPPDITLPAFIEVVVSTVISKSGDTVFGNIACGAILQVDHTPPYGAVPGQPGFGTIVAVNGDCAGVFPRPAKLVASQQQTSPVLPGQTISVDYSIANQGATDASSVVLNENFDQLTPATGSANIGTIAAGGNTAGSFAVLASSIAGRQAGETSVDYQSRLAAFDGRLFTSEGEITFTDPFAQLYAPVEISSFSQLNLPRLTIGLSGLSCIAPGTTVPYQTRIENLGSATAEHIAASVSLPDSTVKPLVVPDLPTGTSFAGTVNWQSPVVAAKGANESTADYLARLQSFDGVVLPAAVASATWQDHRANQYGPIEQPFASLTQRVPIVSVVTPGTQALLPSQKTQLSFPTSNIGTGNAVQVSLQVKKPDGGLVTVPNFTLPGGQSATLKAAFTAPAVTAKGPSESDSDYLARLQALSGATLALSAILSWTDSAGNNYGPTGNPFTLTTQLPVVSIALQAPDTANSGDTITYTVTLTNNGSAAATGVSATATLPDGAQQPLTLPASTIAAGASLQATFTYAIPKLQRSGDISAKVTTAWKDAVSNSYGPVSASATTTVKQANLAPVVNAGPDQTVPFPNNYPLQGSVTDDGLPEGTLIINWTQISGPAPAVFLDPHSPTTVVSLTALGTYVFRLTADDTQLQSSATVSITTTRANLPPVVTVGPNQTITLPVNTASLTGSAVDDGLPVGSTLTFHWSAVAGPAPVTFANPAAPSTVATFSQIGVYILQLSASDSQLTGTAQMRVTVLPTNAPPLVNAGPNQTITLPLNTVTLAGSASDDGLPAGSVLKTSWSVVSGPSAVLFGNPASPVTTALFTAPGSYLLSLTADDSQFRSTAFVTITVNSVGADQPPHIISQPITQFILDPAVATPQIQDLSTWQVVDYAPLEETQGASNWVIDSTHTIATQTRNADASILLSGISLSNDTMEGTWAVNTNNDDDFMGFVFGFQDNQHFYLFDWKKADQNDLGFAKRGMSVKVVNASTPLTGHDLWATSGTPGRVQVLFHNTIPWVSFTNYRFTLTFRPGKFNITVLQGTTVLASIDISDSTYTSGKFGFYNYSQDTVVYSGFQRTPLQQYRYNVVAIDAENDPITYSLLNGPTGMAIDPGSGLLTWMAGTGDLGPHQVSVKAIEPSGLFDTQSYVLNVVSQASVSPFGSISLSPASAGPVVVGSSQPLTATFTNGSGAPVANAVITFKVDGPNARVGTATTDANGKANFSYIGTKAGVDSVVASTLVGSTTLNSNTSTINWVVPAQPISTTTVNARFFSSNGSGPFNTLPTATPAFTMNIPTINFNPPSGTVPGTPGSINVNTRPFTDVTTDLNGNFTGAIVAQGNGLQAGVGSLGNYQAVFTGTYTVAAAGDITFNFFSDDGFIFGVGNGATRVSGSLFNPPPNNLTPFQNYPVMGSFNTATAPVANTIVVHFPAPGSYPFEVDYSECCAGELSLIMTSAQTGGHGIPPSGAITLSPGTNLTRSVGQSVTFTALLTDASGAVIPNTPVTFNVAGVNTLQSTAVTDSTGRATFTYRSFATGTDIVQAQSPLTGFTAVSNQTLVTWSAATNTAPVVSAGTNQTITLPTTSVVLTGTATDDGLPNGTLTTTWSQVSGPAQSFIQSPNQLSTLVGFTQPGTYVFKLTASDSVLSASANVTVTVNQQNLAPSISISVDTTVITQPANTVHVTGTITDDGLPAGSTVTAQWSQVSGPAAAAFSNPASANTNITLTAAGTYVLKLTASDSQLSSSVTVTITVNPPAPNQAPVVSITASQNAVTLPANVVSLAGKITDDGLPVGGAITVQWSQVSGPLPVTFNTPTSASTQVGFPAAGTYVLQLAASDSQLTGTASISITVNAVGTNQPPIAAIIADRTSITLPTNTVTLTGVINDDGLPSGSISTQWAQASGPAAVNITQLTPTSVQVAFPAAGSYGIRLTASDGQLSDTANISITVTSPGGNQPPTVSAGQAQTITLPQNTVTLNGFAADDGLPAGSTLSILWSKISGPGTVTFTNPALAVTQATFSTAGVYVLQLRASDSLLQTTAQVSITVNPAVVPPPSPPVVSIATLADGAEITKSTPIVGSVSSGSWKLEYSLLDGAGNPTTFTTFAFGTTPVSNSTLGTFDPTMLLNGQYLVRFSSTDAAGQTASTSSTVDVSRNAKVGNFTMSFNDLSVPLPGLPITVTRIYDSRDKRVGDFGVGWTLSVANVRVQKSGGSIGKGWDEEVQWSGLFPTYCLQPLKNHFVSVTFPDGKVYKFQAASLPQCQQFVPITAPQISFTQVSTGSATAGATLTPIGASDFLLDGSIPGPLNIIDFDLNFADYSQFRMVTAEGFKYDLDLQAGATRVTDPNGNTLTINPQGITSSSGPGVAFTRDAQRRITQIADPAGNLLVYAYDAAGNLVSFTDRSANVTTFSYDSNHLLLDVIDPRGVHAARTAYDADGRLISTTDANGNTTTFTHDVTANHEIITDRLGNQTLYEYDANGNVTRVTDAIGNTTSSTYDPNDNKLTDTNALGKTTSFTYDTAGNRLTETDPLGHITRFTYNGRRQPLTVTDALGHVTTNIYDTKGNLTSSKDPLGNVTAYTYNAQGMPLTVTDALSNATSFIYDSAGHVTLQTDTLGNVSNFTYDANGNRLTQAVKRTKSDGALETLTTQYQYDANNRLARTTNPDLSTTQVVYNSVGKQSDTIDALGRTTHYDYDTNGRLIKTTYPDLTFESITYDANDRRLTSTDRSGRTTSFTYNAVDRLVKTTYADLSTTQTVYDAAGRTIQSIDALGNATSYAYDDAGRRISMTDALGHVTSFAYDAVGNQTSITDALNHTTQLVYDNAGRRVRTIYPDLTADSLTYDALGRQLTKTDQAGKIIRFGYDALGRLVTVTDALSQITRYTYDELGNRITQTDANNHSTSYSHDQLGRRVQRKLPLGQGETYSYDAAGNLTARTDFNGHTTTYSYDTLNRMLSKTADPFFSQGACAGLACGATSVTFTYTATGRRASMTDASGTTSYTYDNRDQLLTKSTSSGTLTYTYDAAGNTLSLRSSNTGGADMTYIFDALNRLESVTDAIGGTTYSYDAVGNLNSVAYPNGVSTSYTYSPLNRLTNMKSICASGTGCGASGAAISSYAYTLGPAGNRLSVVELSGRTVRYGYDDLYRLISEAVSGSAAQNGSISYQYDSVGNRLQINSTLPAIPSSGLLNYDANDHTATDSYDANGNLLNGNSGSNIYDFENRLAQAGAVKIVYDGDGNRVSETVAGITTKYLVADQNLTGYAQVLDELQNGAIIRTYTYGLELINEHQTISGTPAASFYGFDGHGSVRFLTDLAGAITDTYDYDAFGNLITETGSTPNNYLFAGEQFDSVLGIYYNRARHYDQRAGRFWSMDGFEGYVDDPRTLHKYLYVGNEPTDRNDRSGHDFSVASLSINIAISATIDAIAGFKANGVRGALEGGLKGALIGAAFFAFGGVLGAAGSKLVAFARASTTAGRIALDTNVLIAALEGGEKAAVDAALAGRVPVISITAAKEFLARGDINLLRQFLTERGGSLAASATAAEIAQLQAQATLLGRVLAAADAAVSGSAIREGIPLLTRDMRLINFLQAVGHVVETF